MTVLYSVYAQVQAMEHRLEEVREEGFKWRYVNSRLGKALRQADGEERGQDYFYTVDDGQRSLVFTYDRGVDIRPAFSGLVLGRLMLDEERRLLLLSWPLPEDGKIDVRMHQEVLLEGVEAWSLRFFKPPNPKEGQLQGLWQTSWTKDDGKRPPLMQVELELVDGERAAYVFQLPYSDAHVIYRG
jgi:hypothetical protein